MKRFRLIFFIIGVMLLIPYAGANEIEKNKITLSYKGCPIIRRAFMIKAAAVYEKKTGVHIDVMGGGTTLGIRSAASGESDVGGSSRPALPDRFAQEKNVRMVLIGWDALVFITYADNPVSSISLEQAKAVLLGKITNWKSLGGSDHKIIPVFRSQGSEYGGKFSGVEYMTRLMLFNNPEIDFTHQAIFYNDSSEVEAAIVKLPYSFGVTGVSSARKLNVKILKLDSIEPSVANIKNGIYPLYRPLYLMVAPNPKPEVKAFIDWMRSDSGQAVLASQQTVTLKEGKALNAKFRYWQHLDMLQE
jgi:phosphate transport system substrate-binding protein